MQEVRLNDDDLSRDNLRKVTVRVRLYQPLIARFDRVVNIPQK